MPSHCSPYPHEDDRRQPWRHVSHLHPCHRHRHRKIALAVLFAFLCDYADDIALGQSSAAATISATMADVASAQLINFLIGVHIMVFVGFGFLMAFLQHGGISSLAYNLLVACVVLQWSLLTNAFWERALGGADAPAWGDVVIIDVRSVVRAEFAAATALIAMGAVLGRVHEGHLCVPPNTVAAAGASVVVLLLLADAALLWCCCCQRLCCRGVATGKSCVVATDGCVIVLLLMSP